MLASDLEEQVALHQLQKQEPKMRDLFYSISTGAAFAKNENLFSMMPKLYVTPDYVVKNQQAET